MEGEFQGALDQAGPTRGRDALLDYWRRFWAAWRPGARWEIEELRNFDDEQVLACGRLRDLSPVDSSGWGSSCDYSFAMIALQR